MRSAAGGTTMDIHCDHCGRLVDPIRAVERSRISCEGARHGRPAVHHRARDFGSCIRVFGSTTGR